MNPQPRRILTDGARSATLVLFLLAATARATQRAPDGEVPPPPYVLATVNGSELTFDVGYEAFLASHADGGALAHGPEAARDLADRLVERELFLLEADTLDVSKEPAVLAAVESYRGRVAVDEFWKRAVEDRVSVTVVDVESFYAKTDVALRLTLIETADRANAEALRARVRAGEDMGKLARTDSIHDSRNIDGALSYVRRGDLERSVEDAAFALTQPGSLTEVVKSDAGWAFVRLDDRSVSPDRPPRDRAIPQIRGILTERAQKKLATETDERIAKDAEVWVDEARLTRKFVLDGRDADTVVARSAGDALSLAELREGLDLATLRSAPADVCREAALQCAGRWARDRALVKAAKQAGLFDDPLVTRKVEVFSRDVILKRLYDNYVWPESEPTDAELKHYYEQHKTSEFTTPLEVRLAYILVATEDEANAVRARLGKGEDFEKLARELSVDAASAIHGGRIGWVQPDDLLPQLEAVAAKLAIGATSGPVATAEGAFVLRVLDRKEPVAIPFDRARAAAMRSLTEQRRQQAYSTWVKALRARAKVSLDEAGLAQAVAWLDAEAARRAAADAKKPAVPSGEQPPGRDAPAQPLARKPGGRKQP